jgi:hypothetical protein
MFDNYRLTRKNSSFDLDNKMLPNPRGKRIEGSTRNFRRSLFNGSYVQNGCQDFLPSQAVVCAYGLRLSSGSPLPICADLGIIEIPVRRYWVTEGFVCPRSVGDSFSPQFVLT